MSRISVRVRDVHIDYEIFEDRRAAIRDRLVNRQGTGRRVVKAIRGVTFDVLEGEAVGVIGPNGSGKSTLLSAVAGLLPVTSGEILVTEEPKLLGVGVNLLPGATGRRNIWIGCLALGMSTEEAEERAEDIAAFTDLGEALDRPLRTYSSGMRARVHFAIATSIRPKILLIDEALAVGDQAFKRRSLRRMQEVLDSAGTVMIVSHSLDEIKNQTTRALWIDNGLLVADGPTGDIVDLYTESVH